MVRDLSALLLVGDVLAGVDPERVDIDGLVERVRVRRELLPADLARKVSDPHLFVTAIRVVCVVKSITGRRKVSTSAIVVRVSGMSALTSCKKLPSRGCRRDM